MDATIQSFPAVLNFTDDVAPLLSMVGIDTDTVMTPITIAKGYVRYQRLETDDEGYRIIEDLTMCDGEDILIGLGVNLPISSLTARFDSYGCMKVAIGCLVLDEVLVVYPAQPTVGP